MRRLRELIDALDEDRQLDPAARDRITTAFVGAVRREMDAADKRRFHRKLRGVGR